MKNLILLIFLLAVSCELSYSQIVKLEEDFDSLDIEGRGWKLINGDGSMGDYPDFTEPFTFTNTGLVSAQSGRYFIHYDALNANDLGLIDQWIVTPQVSNIGKYDVFSFWCGAVDKEFKDSIRVLISTTGNEIEDFAEIDRFKVDGPSGAWHEKTYDLSPYAGKNIFVAINYHLRNGGVLGANSDNVWIDHFKIAESFGPDLNVNTFELSQNYPNPFNPTTRIVFSIPVDANVQIRVYDITGKETEVLVNGRFNEGRYSVAWNAAGYASGAYFYKITATSIDNSEEDYTDTKQMVLIK